MNGINESFSIKLLFAWWVNKLYPILLKNYLYNYYFIFFLRNAYVKIKTTVLTHKMKQYDEIIITHYFDKSGDESLS